MTGAPNRQLPAGGGEVGASGGFLAQHARTRGFTLGSPHSFVVRPDGGSVLFLRSRSGSDPLTGLWSLDVATRREELLVDPSGLDGGSDDLLTMTEREQRERPGVHAWARVAAEGIAAYSTDASVSRVCFVVSRRLWLRELGSGELRPLGEGIFLDPRLDPAGSKVAFVRDGDLLTLDLASGAQRTVLAGEPPDVSYGLPEYVASDMRRSRGYWWSPDGGALLAARVDERAVQHWHIPDLADPDRPPATVVRPMAGGPNAEVTLWIVGGDRSEPVPVEWDRAAFEYLVSCTWSRAGLLLAVQSRDQRDVRVLEVDTATGRTRERHRATDTGWVTTFAALPALLGGGELVWADTRHDTHTLLVDGEPVTPPGLQLVDVLEVADDSILFLATPEQTETHVWTYSPESGLAALSDGPGVHTAVRGGDASVVTSESLDGAPVSVVRRGGREAARIGSHVERPLVELRLELLSLGPNEVRTALLLPRGHEPGGDPLPVLLDPYGGLALRRVVKARSAALLVSQWFADQGFAVVVADGRGTPARSPSWERAVHGDIETAPLDDQLAALAGVADRYPGLLDLERVAIRGWSWGGYLAGLAVLRRPDVFHAAIVGAAVADQRLYHTYWKERQLGDPAEHPELYDRLSLPSHARELRRPLLLVHGLQDDNVLAAHAFRFSQALIDADRPHELLLLAGHGHHAIRQPIAEHIFARQLDFLRRSLRIDAAATHEAAAGTTDEEGT